MAKVNEQGKQANDKQEWRKEWREPHGCRIFLFLAVKEVQCGKKQDAGSKSTQEKIQRYLPVPDIEMRIHQGFIRPLTIISSLILNYLCNF